MGLKDDVTKSGWISNTSQEYDEELVVASINAFKNNLELIDNFILNNLVYQNKAPYELIKTGAENEELLDASLKGQFTTEHSKHSADGQLLPQKQIQSNSKLAHNQSTLSLSLSLSIKNFKTSNKTSINAPLQQSHSQR